MFAAARFGDLPELHELRTIFSERFGKSLEYYVNKEVVIHYGFGEMMKKFSSVSQIFFSFLYLVCREVEERPSIKGHEASVNARYSNRIWFGLEFKSFGK